MKKILAGRGAVNYYLEQTRRGLADYYLADQATPAASTDGVGARLAAPGRRGGAAGPKRSTWTG